MTNNPHAKLILEQAASKCLLCHLAPCTKACKSGYDPAAFIKSVRFNNRKSALSRINTADCADCGADCEKACIHYDFPVRIKDMIMLSGSADSNTGTDNIDLSVDFCGVTCENPFFLASSVISSNYEMCANALRMGWGGLVFKTIGAEPPEEVSPRFEAVGKEKTSFMGLRNLEQIAEHTLEENLGFLRRLKEDFPDKVIVASIMGGHEEEWTYLAQRTTETGVDMIECNFSCPHMTGDGLGSDVGQNPELVKRYTAYTRRGTHLPILAKMTPNLGNMEIPAIAAVEGGADGIAAINTIKSIGGVDIGTMTATLNIRGKSSVSGYSGKAVKPIALRFIHDIKKNEALKKIPVSGMGGIESWSDAAEFISLGCLNIQITTAVMYYGYRIIEDLISGLKRFMKNEGYSGINDFCGKALDGFTEPSRLNRDTIMYPVFNREKCAGCGRCYISCEDAGHQAVKFVEDIRKPALNAKKCVGCHLCLLVCPCDAIETSKRVLKSK